MIFVSHNGDVSPQSPQRFLFEFSDHSIAFACICHRALDQNMPSLPKCTWFVYPANILRKISTWFGRFHVFLLIPLPSLRILTSTRRFQIPKFRASFDTLREVLWEGQWLEFTNQHTITFQEAWTFIQHSLGMRDHRRNYVYHNVFFIDVLQDMQKIKEYTGDNFFLRDLKLPPWSLRTALFWAIA